MPVIELCPARLVIILFEILLAPLIYVIFIAVIVLVEPVQLLNVLPVIVLIVPTPPSVLLKPSIADEPVTVILEKLLPVMFRIEPAAEVELLVEIVTAPADVLVKPVT